MRVHRKNWGVVGGREGLWHWVLPRIHRRIPNGTLVRQWNWHGLRELRDLVHDFQCLTIAGTAWRRQPAIGIYLITAWWRYVHSRSWNETRRRWKRLHARGRHVWRRTRFWPCLPHETTLLGRHFPSEYFSQSCFELLLPYFAFGSVVELPVELHKLVLVEHEPIDINSLCRHILYASEHLIDQQLRILEFAQ